MFTQYSKTLKYVYRFAAASHGEQKRKYTGEPYIAHCFSVAERVKNNGGGSEEMMCAALLHDVIEDTDLTSEDLVHYLLGLNEITIEQVHNIHKWVLELTDVFTKEEFPTLNRATRKILEAKRMADVSPEAKEIKFHDLEDNEKSVKEYDPNFYKVFKKEKEYLLKCMGFGAQDSKQ